MFSLQNKYNYSKIVFKMIKEKVNKVYETVSLKHTKLEIYCLNQIFYLLIFAKHFISDISYDTYWPDA